jgi:hypothetical protein
MTKSIILLSCLLTMGCSRYWSNRAADARDVFTASAGLGTGATARVGPISSGLGYHESRIGLVGGTWFNGIGKIPADTAISEGNIALILFGFDGLTVRDGEDRGKEYVNTIIATISFPGMIMAPPGSEKISASYYTQIEASVGLLGGIKLGFNPGELLDLILGTVGIDVYSDDIAGKDKGK